MATSASNRGTLSRHPGRFQVTTVVSDEADTARPTRYHREQARSIITHNQSPDLHFDSSINPYRGCEHGCIYCFARPTTPMWTSLRGRTSRPRFSVSTTPPRCYATPCANPAIAAGRW